MSSAARRPEQLTPEAVRTRLEELRTHLGDPEAFHSREDILRDEVLEAIRDGRCARPAECAAVALESNGWDGAMRWYA